MMAEQVKKSHGFLTYIKTKGRLPLLIGGALLGVFLLLFGGMGESAESEETIDVVSLRVAELEAYEARIEKEIKVICEATAGVGDSDVMITFESGYTLNYTKDGDKNPATVGSGSSEEALFDTLSPPAVAGVGIVCRGGHDPQIQQTLTELVSTALGIPANRVYITGK